MPRAAVLPFAVPFWFPSPCRLPGSYGAEVEQANARECVSSFTPLCCLQRRGATTLRHFAVSSVTARREERPGPDQPSPRPAGLPASTLSTNLLPPFQVATTGTRAALSLSNLPRPSGHGHGPATPRHASPRQPRAGVSCEGSGGSCI